KPTGAAKLLSLLSRSHSEASAQKVPDPQCVRKLSAFHWGKDPVLLFVGRLIAAKGAQELMLALPYLFKSIPRLKVVIVGEGPLRPSLEDLLCSLRTGSKDKIRISGKAITDSNGYMD